MYFRGTISLLVVKGGGFERLRVYRHVVFSIQSLGFEV